MLPVSSGASETGIKSNCSNTQDCFPLRLSAGVGTIDAIKTLGRALMFSHVVIFWVKPEEPQATEKLMAGMHQYLKPIPGIIQFHAGRMVPSHRPVVEQSYQAALNVVFADKAAQDAYQVHPLHVEFVEKILKPNVTKVLVYDFEGGS
jgi:hypothetical protein